MTNNNVQRILLQDRVKLLQKQIMESKSPHLHKFLAKEVKTEEIWGMTCQEVLITAALKGVQSIILWLIEPGVDVNASGAEGFTALMLAVIGGHESIIKFLVNQGANVNIRDAEGVTALMKALIFDHKVIFEHLIRNGANNIYLQDNREESIIDIIEFIYSRNEEIQSKYITLCCFGEKNKQIIKNKEGKKLAELFPTIYEKITKKEKEIAENYGFFRQEGSQEIDYRKLRDWFLLSVNEKATTMLLARGGLLIGDGGRKECPIEIMQNILSFIVPYSLSRHQYPKIATIPDDVSNVPEDLPLRSYTPGGSRVG